MTRQISDILDFITAEWQRDVAPEAMAAARALADTYGDATVGVLFYGSCLRTGIIADRILDFYVIVRSYRAAYGAHVGGRLLAVGNAVLPPNVFYHEIDADGVCVRSKYAVLSLEDYEARTRPDVLNVSVWARFCQPAVLLCAADDDVYSRLRAATAEAAKTMVRHAVPLAGGRDSETLWPTAFDLTYRSELRSEPEGKGQEIYDLDKDRYDRLTPLILDAIDDDTDVAPKRAKRLWALRRLNGKTVSFLRLIKAAFTFQGGIDYLAWKISRHSGVAVEIAPWMRRVPIVAGLYLFVTLRLKGAFR